MKKIKLDNPIKVDGVVVSEISLRQPKVRDLLVSGKKNVSEEEKEVNLIANLAEIPVDSVEDLDLRDYLKIQDWLKDFLSATSR